MFPSGNYRTTGYEMSLHFENAPVLIEKFNPERIITAVYFDAESGQHYIKRFHPELSDKFQSYIGEQPENKLISISLATYPRLKVNLVPKGRKQKTEEVIDVHEFIGVKGFKAKGKRIASGEVKSVEWLEPEIPDVIPQSEPEPENTNGDANGKSGEAETRPSVMKDKDNRDDLDAKQITLDFE
jgi:topoisomerase-4 subunit A